METFYPSKIIKNKKDAIVIPPKPDPEKLVLYNIHNDRDEKIYRLVEQVSPDIIPIFPELANSVIGIRTGEMNSCIACWDFCKDQVVFTNTREWDALEMGATLAHELTHAFHHKIQSIPSGERATDLYMLARIPLKYLMVGCPSYLECADDVFQKYPEKVQELAKAALINRKNGLRCYIRWFEDEIDKIHYGLKGEPVPTRPRPIVWGNNNKT